MLCILCINTINTELGPSLVRGVYMRMEGKNSYFKRAAQSSNFKNVAYSVARQHQRLLCGYLQSKQFFDQAHGIGPGVKQHTVLHVYVHVCALDEYYGLTYVHVFLHITGTCVYTCTRHKTTVFVSRLHHLFSPFPSLLFLSYYIPPFSANEPMHLQAEDTVIIERIMEVREELKPTPTVRSISGTSCRGRHIMCTV